MKKFLYRTVCILLFAVLVLSTAVTGTLGWQSSQQTKNETAGAGKAFDVNLLKLEKLSDGTLTKTPISGAGFYLYTSNGEQIGGLYKTDKNGRVQVQLKKGDYVFEEAFPTASHMFDRKDGTSITRYPFSVKADSVKVVTVKAYNIRLDGSLIIQKTVQNADSTQLTKEQKEKKFEFTVKFSDNGTYSYRINGGSLQTLKSGESLHLRHGDSAVFENIPVGVLYDVTETPEQDYYTSSNAHRGNITENGCTASFINTYVPEPPPPDRTAKLKVTKKLFGEYSSHYIDKAFNMTLDVNGKKTKFSLKPNETVTFDIPAGAYYEVNEDNCYDSGFSQSVINGAGIAQPESLVEVVVDNTYVGTVYKEIDGKKTWDLGKYSKDVLPEAITVLLKNGDKISQQKTVKPDKNGDWKYSFTAEKYDANGKEIKYTVEEVPIKGFSASYDGNNIKNTYIPPVTVGVPSVEKVVKGKNAPKITFKFTLKCEQNAPMPEGSSNDAKLISVNGSGTASFGKITFDSCGTYKYTVSEQIGSDNGWSYDTSSYLLTYTITEKNNKLKADCAITKNGKTAKAIKFINRYDELNIPDKTVISGTKTWNHGSNPKEQWPTEITVEVYGDNTLAIQYQVTEKDNWSYRFELPKYAADGHKISYRVSEVGVANYITTVDGYNLINTFEQQGDTPNPPDDNSSNSPDSPETPVQTGDRNSIAVPLTIMIISFVLLVSMWLTALNKRKKE